MTVLLDHHTGPAETIRRIAQVLGRAFFEDPFYTYVMPDATERSDQLTWWMSCMARYGLGYGRVYATTPPIAGAAIGSDRTQRWAAWLGWRAQG